MKKLIALVCLGVAFTTSIPAFAAPATPAQLAQREKMKTCNADAKAKQLKKEERSAFMKKCMSGSTKADAAKPAVAAKPASSVAAAPVAVASAVAKTPTGVKAAAPATSAVAATAANNAAASSKQKLKTKACNEEVKTKKLKGDDRRKFLTTCLQG